MTVSESEVKLKYKVLKEYDYYYLTECSVGYKECFLKYEYEPINGYIEPRNDKHQGNHIGLKPQKVNKSFNPYYGVKVKENENVKDKR